MKGEKKMRRVTARRGGLRNLARFIGFSLLIASVVRELRLPKEERTWHGTLFGKVPYDLRPPSFSRLKTVLWNPENPQLLVPTAFGVGCTVNLGALRARHSGAPA